MRLKPDIRGGVSAELNHQLRRGFVQRRHRSRRGPDAFRPGSIDLSGEGHDAGAQRLGEDQHVARARRRIRDDVVLVDESRDGEARLHLRVVDAVAADDGATGLFHLVDAAAEDFEHGLVGDLPDGESDHRQRGQRRAAHGVDIADGVRGGHLPERVWVVHRRREDVDRLDEGLAVAHVVDAGVVAGRHADQHARILDRRQVLQHTLEKRLIDFRRAARLLHELGQSNGAGRAVEPLACAGADVLLLENRTGARLFGVTDAVPQLDRSLHHPSASFHVDHD